MTFAWPYLLWLLLLPLAGAVWEWRRRRQAADPSASPRILRGAAGARTVTVLPRPASPISRFRLAHGWLLLGLACGIVALARPQWGMLEEQVFDQSREIVIALDLSRSMLTPDVKPSRLERSKLLIQALLDRLAGERVGLVVFSGTAFLQCPLSADYEILREFLPALNPKYLPEGGTNYSALLQTSIEAFATSNTNADRFLIILSDGEDLDDQWRTQLDELKRLRIRALCLGVGTAVGGMIPDGEGAFVKDERGAVVMSRLASSTLQELATATGGAYRDASTWIDLARLLQETVEAGRQGKFLEKRERRRIERFQWVLAPALLFFLLSWWREFPVPIRPRALALATPRREPAPPPPQALASAILLALAGVVGGLSSPPLLAAAPATSSPLSIKPPDAASTEGAAAPLALTVKRLADSPAPLARDWAAMARDTLSWGQQLRSSQQTVPPGPVRDGLAAVDAGEKLDAHAADWNQLRSELSSLIKTEPPPPQQPPPQNQDQKSSPEKKPNPSKPPENPSQDQKSQPSSQGQQDKSPSSPSGSPPSPPPSPDSRRPDQPPAQPQENSAFGDMQRRQDPPPPPPPSKSAPPEMQKIGGAEKKDPTDNLDPALTLPLQKLEKIKEQDSPARLFQILEGQKKAPPAASGRNW